MGPSLWLGEGLGAHSMHNLPETTFHLKGVNENVFSRENCSLCFECVPGV